MIKLVIAGDTMRRKYFIQRSYMSLAKLIILLTIVEFQSQKQDLFVGHSNGRSYQTLLNKEINILFVIRTEFSPTLELVTGSCTSGLTCLLASKHIGTAILCAGNLADFVEIDQSTHAQRLPSPQTTAVCVV